MPVLEAPRVFVPNAVLIPASAVWKDSLKVSHVEPEECTKLYIHGDRTYGEVYTKEAWEAVGKPSYILRYDTYYTVNDDEETFFCRAGLSISDQEPVEGDRIQLLPDLWCVKEDETEYWDEKFRKEHKVKRIFGVYVINKAKVVYLCEVTPSYDRVFINSQWETDADFEDDDFNSKSAEIEDLIRAGDNRDTAVGNAHVSAVERSLETAIEPGWLPAGTSGGYRLTGLMSVTEEDAIEEIREGLCNGDL